MTDAARPLARSAVGRADLLRALAAGPRARLVLDEDETGWFGYAPRPDLPPMTLETAGWTVSEAAQTAPAQRLPLRMPWAFAVVGQETRAPAETESPEQAAKPATPIDAEAARPLSETRRVGYEDLVPAARLIPALRRQLGATRAVGLDLERLAAELADGSLPRRLPRRIVRRWHPDLVAVLDFCPRLWPYRADMHRLARRLLQHCGQSAVSLRIVNHGPFGGWSDWQAHQNPGGIQEPLEQAWTMPPAGTPVLIVGDLGLLLGAETPEGQGWTRFIAGLRQAQLRPIALVPLGARQVPGALAQALPVLRWSPDAPAHPTAGHGAAQPRPDGLADLLAMMAVARRVDPPLLRALRQLNPTGPLDAGLEGAAWCHGDVAAGFAAAIRTQVQDHHLRRFASLVPALQARLFHLSRHHHAHLPAVIRHEEALVWAANRDPAATGDGAVAEAVAEAVAFLGRLVATVAPPAGSEVAPGDWAAAAAGVLRRADAGPWRDHPWLLSRLAARLRTVKGDAAVPGRADPAQLAAAATDDSRTAAWLVQDAARGWLRLQAEPPGDCQVPLGAPLTIDAGGLRVFANQAEAGTWYAAGRLPLDLAPLSARISLLIETAGDRLAVAAVDRPLGAAGWACGPAGLMVDSPPLGGVTAQWQGVAAVLRPDAVPEEIAWAETRSGALPLPKAAKGSCQVRFGLDHGFGVFADLEIATEHGAAVQRLRWIEPGSFRMGSPADEPEREEREGPRHWVTLTRGFWLADSACTQAMWRAVTGTDPSEFKGSDRPVERVSWPDVQGFLARLEALVPGCGAALPSEAEWEYACRAGTETPFSFGATVTTDQANFKGDFPYAGGPKGQWRRETVAVKSLPPNPWGLFEMHGNVREWCTDGMRTYGDQSVTDPQGPLDSESLRACRGGSWLDFARRVRSAFRIAVLPGDANDYLGFRFCLRSIEPSSGWPGGPPGRAPGRRPAAPPRDEAEPARGSGSTSKSRKQRSPRKR